MHTSVVVSVFIGYGFLIFFLFTKHYSQDLYLDSPQSTLSANVQNNDNVTITSFFWLC